ECTRKRGRACGGTAEAGLLEQAGCSVTSTVQEPGKVSSCGREPCGDLTSNERELAGQPVCLDHHTAHECGYGSIESSRRGGRPEQFGELGQMQSTLFLPRVIAVPQRPERCRRD